jgi:hypothetical protein
MYIIWKQDRLASGLWGRYQFHLLIICLDEVVWKCSSLLTRKFINENIYCHGTGRISNLDVPRRGPRWLSYSRIWALCRLTAQPTFRRTRLPPSVRVDDHPWEQQFSGVVQNKSCNQDLFWTCCVTYEDNQTQK